MIQIIRSNVQAGVSTYEASSTEYLGTRYRLGALLTLADVTVPLDAETQIRLLGRVAEFRDREAFALLFKHFAPRVKAFHMRSGLTDSGAEELTQETMLLLWRKAEGFDPARAGVSTWLFTIARNLRIDRARHLRRPAPEPPPDEEFVPSAETQALECEQAARMRGALEMLSGEQRRVIELSFFSGTPHAAIAAALSLPLGTVKSRIRLALARLRDALGAEP